jgi:polysaccharide biosynthesis/export protein
MACGKIFMMSWFLLVLVLTPGAVSGQKSEPGAKLPQPSPVQRADNTYVISPGDMLDVQVWKEPENSKTVPVRPDGKISLPLVNDVQAAGLTASALAADLTERLKKYMSDPEVTVIVSQVNSQRFYITGEVSRGGTYALMPGMTVLQGLSSAGGFTVFANIKKIYVLRQENGKQVRYPFNYRDVVKGKDTAQNILLKPGDTIVVP